MIKVSVMYPNTPGARFDHERSRGGLKSLARFQPRLATSVRMS